MTIYVLRVTDTHGNRFEGAVADLYMPMPIRGLKDEDGNPLTFGGFACNVTNWVEGVLGGKVEKFSVSVNLDVPMAWVEKAGDKPVEAKP